MKKTYHFKYVGNIWGLKEYRNFKNEIIWLDNKNQVIDYDIHSYSKFEVKVVNNKELVLKNK